MTRWISCITLAAVSAVGLAALPAHADVTSDRPAAILFFPRIAASGLPIPSDTVVQITNVSNELQVLHCFYVNATSHCSSSGDFCDEQTPCGAEGGLCQPGWIETDFFVYLTPRQPLAWRASEGLADEQIPLDGHIRTGPTGDSNEGTRVPPIGEVPYEGELKCIVVDQDGRPVGRNVVKGEATLVREDEIRVGVAKYNAVGLEGFEGDVDDNRVLVLGGGSNEYAGCPNILVVNHFFDFAISPAETADAFISELTLVPCTEDLLNQIPGRTTAQFLVFNEFEQRFSTSVPVECYFERQLSRIDTTNPVRSIFSVFVTGTIAGQTRIRGVQEGLIGVLHLRHAGADSAYYNLHTQGDREAPDFITLP